jgi:2-phospho-L-lactate transferase/gluconeogenesis factor (CofD/UPF0052 family)
MSDSSSSEDAPKVVLFSGGTALNGTARALRAFSRGKTYSGACLASVTYVIPTTDDGGSTAEILRYFGGPAIGDIRNRLLRLAGEHTPEARAVKHLLELRLPGRNTSHHCGTHGHHRLESARDRSFNASVSEWSTVLDGTHSRWTEEISFEFRDTVLAFLNHFEVSVQQRRAECPSLGPFDYRNGSIGNFFFTGARLFFRSLSAAIFWWSRVAQIPPTVSVLPSSNELKVRGVASTKKRGDGVGASTKKRGDGVDSSDTGAAGSGGDEAGDGAPQGTQSLTLGAELTCPPGSTNSSASGKPGVSIVIGQSAISHPTHDHTIADAVDAADAADATVDAADAADATTDTYPYTAEANGSSSSMPTPTAGLAPGTVDKMKSGRVRFPNDAKITKLFFVAMPSRQRVAAPCAHPRTLDALREADTIVYGIGSLFTSIVAGLTPKGVGDVIFRNAAALKVLVLNGDNDRETGGFCAMEYVQSIVKALHADATRAAAGAAEHCDKGQKSAVRVRNAPVVSDYVNSIVVLASGRIPWSQEALAAYDIQVTQVPDVSGTGRYDAEVLAQTLVGLAKQKPEEDSSGLSTNALEDSSPV